MRVGVIGTGSMGRNHVRVLSEIAELVGIADPDREARENLANKYGIQSYGATEELLAQKPEAVVVATPTEHHYSIAKTCMEKGVHVLLEKPMCKTPEEGEELVKLAEQNGLTFAIGQIERHNPVVGAAKDHLSKGTFGELFTMSSKRVSSFPARIRDVGVIMDLGIHDIDAMRHLAGSEVASVYATAGMVAGSDKEKYGNILLQFENGVSGFVEVNWVTPMKVRKLWLTCANDFVELDYMNQSLMISSSQTGEYDANDLFRVPYEYHIRNVALKKSEPLKRELQDFLDAIENKKEPLVTGRDGLNTLRVALAALESYRTKSRVEMQ
ncbi:MAG: Gfo/Idh/MocA family oxidoreductase [Candidatus Thermoplasmatota archaeon]|nr:Gfo/Idh/MocA family oxidoreductase [Candidatus Thermoplasmatota archaeon]